VCSRSSFFNAACAERWSKSGSSTTIELPEDDVNIFNVYLHTLYRNFPELGGLQSSLDAAGIDNPAETPQCLLVATYLFAHKVRDIFPANIIADQLYFICRDELSGPVESRAAGIATQHAV
jgi:hypothetical protein